MMANSVGALAAIAQMGALELHPWGSRAPKLGFPDRMVFDFDPDEALKWKAITEAVSILKTLLDSLGLRGFQLMQVKRCAPYDSSMYPQTGRPRQIF
jgi:bifunctional non-homologous end joining protein LigD